MDPLLSTESGVPYLSHDEIVALDLPLARVFAGLEAALVEHGRGAVEMPPKIGVHTRPGTFIHAMPSYLPSLGACDLLFVPATEASVQKDAAAAVKGKPCLTVGESPDFTKQGGIIGFFTQDNKLRFEINLDTAAANGLKVQSQLLKLARVVKSEESEKG